jgi:hypothetical protein
MEVPDNWWPGWGDRHLNKCEITSIDETDPDGKYFKFQIVGGKHEKAFRGESWPMRFDAVLSYADRQNPEFSRFDLPTEEQIPVVSATQCVSCHWIPCM